MPERSLRLAASVAFYTIFSIAPILLIAVEIASVALVLAVGFLLLVSLVLSALLAALQEYLADQMPGSSWMWQVGNFLVSFAVVSGLFATIYKYLPDVQITWRDVATGSVVTAIACNRRVRDRGGRYLLLPPPKNRTLIVEPNEVMSGDVVFFGPVRSDIDTLTLTAGVPGASGTPLALTMNAATGGDPGIVVRSVGTNEPLALQLDGKASVPAGVEITVDRIELVPEGSQVNVVAENRSGSNIALNQSDGFSLRDNGGHTYRFQPPLATEPC